MMIAKLDRDGCISCGLCAETCPEVFRMADDGIAEVWQGKRFLRMSRILPLNARKSALSR